MKGWPDFLELLGTASVCNIDLNIEKNTGNNVISLAMYFLS